MTYDAVAHRAELVECYTRAARKARKFSTFVPDPRQSLGGTEKLIETRQVGEVPLPAGTVVRLARVVPVSSSTHDNLCRLDWEVVSSPAAIAEVIIAEVDAYHQADTHVSITMSESGVSYDEARHAWRREYDRRRTVLAAARRNL